MFGLDAEEWRNIAAAMQSIVTAVALIIGGWWAYRRFVRERDHAERLGMEIEARLVTVGTTRGIHVTVSITNHGKVLTCIEANTGGLAVERFRAADLAIVATSSSGEVYWPSFPAQLIEGIAGPAPVPIEPGECWTVTALFTLPNEDILALRVTAEATTQRGTACSTDSIITQ